MRRRELLKLAGAVLGTLGLGGVVARAAEDVPPPEPPGGWFPSPLPTPTPVCPCEPPPTPPVVNVAQGSEVDWQSQYRSLTPDGVAQSLQSTGEALQQAAQDAAAAVRRFGIEARRKPRWTAVRRAQRRRGR